MEKFDIENFPTSVSAQNMLHSISEDFYQNSYVMKWLLQVMGLEWDDASEIIASELAKQLFIETATWGLRYHEEKWQLPVRENLEYEERRKLLYEKRDFKAPMTPYRMEQYLATKTGAEVHIMDCHDPGDYGYIPEHPNMFKAVFIKEDTLDVTGAKRILNKLKQSHAMYFRIVEMIEIILDHSKSNRLNFCKSCVRVAIPFSEKLGFNSSEGKVKTKVSMRLEKIQEKIGAITVTTKKNFWVLDGSVLLNGEKNLDSTIKKEEL